jgi:REP element-mobilizing transposase RayT
LEPTKQYHLYTHANGFENLFRTDENFRYFLQRYEYFIPNVADTLAYCLMPNHLHLLVRVKEEEELLAFFKTKYPTKDLTGLVGDNKQDLSGLGSLVVLQFSHLFNAYTKAYNKVYQRRGSLFTRAFKRKEITDDSYFTQLIHYIHANPVHHGFVKNINDWRWSSFDDILNEEPSLVNRKEIIDWFGNKKEFLRFHNRPISIRTELEIDR